MKRNISVMIALAFVIGAKTLSAGAESDTSAVVRALRRTALRDRCVSAILLARNNGV